MIAWSAFSEGDDGVWRKGELRVAVCETGSVQPGSHSASTVRTIWSGCRFQLSWLMTDILQITDTLAVPRSELVYRASRSGGAGGQHVNTSSTRIELLWDFEKSAALDEVQKDQVRKKLEARIDAEGLIRVVAGNRRSQLQNRMAAEERLAK